MKVLARGKNSRGNATIEFTLVGIPMIFVLISSFEMARGMWLYDTLAHAVREGTRFAIVRGSECARHAGCPVTVADVANQIKNNGVGLLPGDLDLTFVDYTGAAINCKADACPTTIWPPPPNNRQGQPVSITGAYPFRSAIAMFWPGAGPGMTFAATTFRARSQELIEF